MSLLTKIFGDPNKRYIQGLQPFVDQINGLENNFQSLNDTALREKTNEFRQKIDSGTPLDDLLPGAFAAVREASKRTIKQRHYDVQLLGGVVLHRGQIAEMRTGEGKTLVATLPVYLNALQGKGVHVVTVNDYLARRDATWMGQIYRTLGLSVGCIAHEQAYLYDSEYSQISNSQFLISNKNSNDQNLNVQNFKVEHEFLRPVSRREAYAADITYGTNNEYGFDYLRDNMVTEELQMVQRGHHFAIVDEVDSILIDEARTPLIISAPAEESEELYYKFASLAQKLKENEDYNVDEKMRAATLTEAGIAKIEKMLNIENLYDAGGLNLVHHAEQSLRAHALYKLDRDYVVKDGQVIIVDEFTGRLMPGRRWSEGLHQAVEAKEGVKIERESQTLATVTFQNYFRLYKKLAGMTGTALTEAEEFHKIYNLEVVPIPTNKPAQRKDLPDRVYKNEMGKFKAVIQEIKERNKKGQPVLVGTISIEKNEVLSQLLEREGVKHNLLNAKNHEKEAEIIAQAGRLGAVTIATNMAGRGVDIILGGNPSSADEASKVREAGGLLIIGTERHEARRIDNQLRGRSGRQGDPGSSQFYVSLEDDLMRIFAGDRIKSLMERFHMPEDMPIENSLVSRSIESAQNKVEQNNFDIRKHLLEYDDVLNKHREAIYRRRRDILKPPFTPSSPQRGEDKGGEVNLLRDQILNIIKREIEQVVLFHASSEDEQAWNLKEIYEVINTIFPIVDNQRIQLGDLHAHTDDKIHDIELRTKIIQYLEKLALEQYDNLEKNLQKAAKDEQIMGKIEKGIYLRSIDSLWIEHLDAIEHLRRGIGLRGYGQRDPLVEYKKEAYRMFTELNHLIEKQIVYSIYKVGMATQIAPSLLKRRGINVTAPPKTMAEEKSFAAQPQEPGEGKAPVTSYAPDHPHNPPKVGRNEPCPCGSGKKYKKCHG